MPANSPTKTKTTPPPRLYNDLIYGLAERKRASVSAQLFFFSPLGNLTFNFPFAPKEVSYGSIANTYAQINRPGAFPIIDRTAPQLMTASMQFRVADVESRGSFPIEKELDKLRGMALLPGRLLVGGMDSFLSKPSFPTVRWAGANWAWWRMTDLSIDIVQRTLANKARQANVSLTLTEDRNPWIPTVALPPIVYFDEPIRASTVGTNPPPAGPANPQAILPNAVPPRNAQERINQGRLSKGLPPINFGPQGPVGP